MTHELFLSHNTGVLYANRALLAKSFKKLSRAVSQTLLIAWPYSADKLCGPTLGKLTPVRRSYLRLVLGKELFMTEDGQDPRLSLLLSLDISACRVEFSDAPIVLLCGGQVKSKHVPEDPDPPLQSLRHAITNFHTKFEIFRPEEIKSWQSDGIFKDLISFELELASICTLVVIILESEGALVELGAFSQLPELSNKLVAICPEKYINENSFINLGILRYIKATQNEYVKSYPWEPEPPVNIDQQVIEDVTSDIQDELDKLPKSQIFKIDQNSHVMVLICVLLKLFAALKESEILDYLTICGITVSKDELNGKLFLLTQFRLIKRQNYSDAHFYLRGDEVYHNLRIALKETSKPVDQFRITISFLDYYKKNSSKHRNRIRAIELSAKGMPS